MTDPVNDAWGDIAGWLAGRAPASLAAVRPPAGPDRLAAAEAELGFPLGPDLAAWWSRHDGATFDGGQVLPSYVPYGIDAMLASRRMWLEVADEAWGDWARIAGAEQPAGGMAWAFLPELVPIAFDGSGNDLVVDFRHGPLRGCIKTYAARVSTAHRA